MTYRKIDTEMWADPWFEQLSSKAKLAFIYFVTNKSCNPSGIYEISEKRISFELGYDIDMISSEIKSKVEWYPEQSIIWVKNFFRHQSQSGKFAIAAINAIKGDPFKLRMFIEYNAGLLARYKIDISVYDMDMISEPYPTEQNRTEQNRTEQKQEQKETSQLDVSLPGTKPEKNFPDDSDEVRLSGLLYGLILEKDPKAKKPNIQSWADHIDRTMRIDKRTPDEIEAVIRWCQQDPFWGANILSTKKLREKLSLFFGGIISYVHVKLKVNK